MNKDVKEVSKESSEKLRGRVLVTEDGKKDPLMAMAALIVQSVLVTKCDWPEDAAAKVAFLVTCRGEGLNTIEKDLQWKDMVPSSGVEPELLEEPHFECGASTNSAKRASPWSNDSLLNHEYDERTSYNLRDILRDIEVPFGWGLETKVRGGVDETITMLRVFSTNTVDNVTGANLERWNGRWWIISPHMTESEVVQTVFKAVMTAVEHETRELFKFQGVSVLDPHYDLVELVDLHKGGNAISVRP